jgi:hypothetical protein
MMDPAVRALHEQWFRMMANASLPDAAARALDAVNAVRTGTFPLHLTS